MIQKIENHYIASSGGSWLPGIFACPRAALYAFRLKPEKLANLAAASDGKTPLTMDDLRAAK